MVHRHEDNRGGGLGLVVVISSSTGSDRLASWLV
jgi:hypothetical protein